MILELVVLYLRQQCYWFVQHTWNSLDLIWFISFLCSALISSLVLADPEVSQLRFTSSILLKLIGRSGRLEPFATCPSSPLKIQTKSICFVYILIIDIAGLITIVLMGLILIHNSFIWNSKIKIYRKNNICSINYYIPKPNYIQYLYYTYYIPILVDKVV